MLIFRWAGAMALALICLPAAAQTSLKVVPGPGQGGIAQSSIAYGERGNDAVSVSSANPLPVTSAPSQAAATSTPLAGSTSSASTTLGPFTPQRGRPIWISLSGTWVGTVQAQRSVDGGTTKLPITIGGQTWASYSANANEPFAEETDAAATYYLSVALSSGTLSYRIAQ